MRRAWVLAGMAGIAGITGITGIAGVAGCGGRSAGEPSESAAEVVQARGALDLLARGDVDTFVRTWDVSTRPADLAETVGQVAAGFPHATPDRVRPVGARCGSVHEVGGLTTETCVVTFESNAVSVTSGTSTYCCHGTSSVRCAAMKLSRSNSTVSGAPPLTTRLYLPSDVVTVAPNSG